MISFGYKELMKSLSGTESAFIFSAAYSFNSHQNNRGKIKERFFLLCCLFCKESHIVNRLKPDKIKKTIKGLKRQLNLPASSENKALNPCSRNVYLTQLQLMALTFLPEVVEISSIISSLYICTPVSFSH